MDKMQSKQHTLREETLTRNTLICMICLKKHPINKMHTLTPNFRLCEKIPTPVTSPAAHKDSQRLEKYLPINTIKSVHKLTNILELVFL